MPKILITGNGFDLSYGLPTLYSDFINILSHIENSHDISFNAIYSLTDSYEKIKNDFSVFKFDLKKIETLRNEIKDNTWYEFFKNEQKIETWIDFESKIEYVLKTIIFSLNELNTIPFSKGPTETLELYYEDYRFNKLNVEHFQLLSSFKIIHFYERITHRIVINYHYVKKKLIFQNMYMTGINIEFVLDEIFKDLIDFRNSFSNYFRIFIFPLLDNYKNHSKKLIFSKIENHFTFNYTPTFEKLYNKKETFFLHGKVTENSSNIVLGINGLNSEIKSIIPFTKKFQKFNNNTDYKFLEEYSNKTALTTYQIFIYGHSLDSSDSIYIKEIFNFIKELKSQKKKLIIIYHSDESKSNILKNLFQIIEESVIDALIRQNYLTLLHIDSSDLKSELEKDISYNIKVI